MANGSDREIVADLIQYLIENAIHIQDWPRVMVFRKANDDLLHQYCYKRFPDGDEKLPTYNKLWGICNPKNGCEDCKEIIDSLKEQDLNANPQIGKSFFYKLELSDIFDPKILPFIESIDMVRYKNYLLVFEFPQTTIFPGDTPGGAANGVKKLGEHYISKLTPVFDRLLMKRKVLKHSVNSAVFSNTPHGHGLIARMIPA